MSTPIGLLEEVRELAATSVGDALARATAALGDVGGASDPELLYLVAELHARYGNPHEALDAIDGAQTLFRAAGRELEAERCEIGRAAVLDDLGRLDEAIEAATQQLTRLRQAPRDRHVIDLETRALVNRGTCRESLGDYTSALDDYNLAFAGAQLLDDESTMALVELNRSTVLDLLGRTAEALRGLRWASTVIERVGDDDDMVKVAVNIAAILCRRGEYDDSLTWFHRAEELVEVGTVNEAGIAVEVAEALTSIGALDEAVGRYRDALALLATMPLSWLEGRAWLGLGVCTSRLGDPTAARAALRAALDAFAAADNLPAQVATLLELASLEGDEPSAREFALDQARRALALADPGRWPVQACLAHLKLGDLSLGAEAERSLRTAQRLAARVGLAPLRMRVEQRLGSHLLRHGRPREAAVHIGEAVRLADALRRRLSHGTLLRAFPTQTASCYDDLVEICLLDGDIEAACRAANRARSRSLSDLRGSSLGTSESSAAAREVEAELHAVYDRLLGVERLDVALRGQLDVRANDLETQLDRLEFELRPIVESQAGGETDEAASRSNSPILALTYLSTDDGIDLLVQAPDQPARWHRNVASLGEVISLLEGFHSDGRRAHALRSASVPIPGSLHAGSRRRLARLGEMLLGPIADQLSSVNSSDVVHLAISPVGALHLVPFGALEVAGRAVIETCVVTMCPSHDIRHACSGRPRATGSPLFVGLTEGGLRNVAVEIDRLRSTIQPSSVLTEKEATLQAVTTAAASASVVHLASHGIFRSHAPLRSGVRLADGWLTAHRAAGLAIAGATVVLSACDTGRATVADGEEILGLQYGFLAAGASNVVMSLWPANDELTVDLMVELHRRLADGDSASAALRRAQLSARDADLHPWIWATFICSGAASRTGG